MLVTHHEDSFKTGDGLILFRQSWHARQPAKAGLILVHGYGEHSSRYRWLAKQLVGHGFDVFTYDQRGHGKSEGLRAFVPRFHNLVADLTSFVNVVRGEHKNLGFVGHSMGGLVLLHYAATAASPRSPLVFSSPYLRDPDPPGFLKRQVSAIGSWLLPGFGIPSFLYRLDTNGLSRHEYVVKGYESDLFVYHGPLLNRTAHELVRATDATAEMAAMVTNPLLILHGDADRIADPAGAGLLHERAASQDKTLSVYEGGYHELFNDLDRVSVLDQTAGWLRERLL